MSTLLAQVKLWSHSPGKLLLNSCVSILKTCVSQTIPPPLQVTKLDLAMNEFQAIPPCLLELPCIQELNLQHNKLTEIPNTLGWSPSLAVVDFSHNQLTALPEGITAPSLSSLDLSHNKLRYVPNCVCTFTTMSSLDISWNIAIQTLPDTLGLLKNLTRFNVTGLPNLHDPPETIRANGKECVQYLRKRLRCSKPFNRLKIVVMGRPKGGKSTLVRALCGKGRSKSFYEEPLVDGLHISNWHCSLGAGKRPFTFTLWELGGESKAIHQCFLSNNSIHLLVFSLLHGEKGLEELRPWLDTIALYVPKSQVMIVGTHLDRLSSENRKQCLSLNEKVVKLRAAYPTLLIWDIVTTGLGDNITALKQAICSFVSMSKTMEGQAIVDRDVPESYHTLYNQLQRLREEYAPSGKSLVLHVRELERMILELGITDIPDSSELADTSLFLTDVGSFLHYDDRSHDLHTLFFINPGWLYTVLTRIVEGSHSVAKCKGILQSTDIPHLLIETDFPWEYYEQMVALLAHYEIALPLSSEYLLVPSMLPESRPDLDSISELSGGEEPYAFCIRFGSTPTPAGLWGHLLAQVIHFVPQVYHKLHCLTASSTGSPPQPSATRRRSATVQVDSTVPATQATPLGIVPTSQIRPSTLNTASRPTHPPSLLPNFPSPPLYSEGETTDAAATKLEYWQTGLLFSSPEVSFCIESLSASDFSPSPKEGILITCSRNKQGMRKAGKLLDLTSHLISEWYPNLQIRVGSTSLLDLRLPCYVCKKMQCAYPYEFTSEQCMSVLLDNKATVQCQYDKLTPTNNHSTPLDTIAPHLYFKDLDTELLLNPEDIEYELTEVQVIGKGAFSKVYRGTYKHETVAIKTYRSRDKEALIDLQRETRLLQKCSHPCIVELLGGCMHPIVALILEKAPMGSLAKHLTADQVAIHRIVQHRIAAQVASALGFLHNSGIVLRNLRAANILLWSLSPRCLTHCKLSDFDMATYLPPFGTKGVVGIPGFTAPEVLHVSKARHLFSYTHKADLFSFGMLLYQMITGRQPYHDLKVVKISATVEAGGWPSLHDMPQAKASYHYLIGLMQVCWDSTASTRPEAEKIAQLLCLAPTQLVKNVHPVRSIFSLRHTCVTTYTHFGETGDPETLNELWVCSDSKGGAEFNVLSLATMSKTNTNFIKENIVQCICPCGDHVWVGCTSGIEYGEIHIFNTSTTQIVLSIKLGEHSFATCIVSNDNTVIVGVVNGQCLLYDQSIEHIQVDPKPSREYNVYEAIDGIVAVQGCIWISHSRHISIVNLEDLTLVTSLKDFNNTPVGQLHLSTDEETVWSAHQTSPILSAWQVTQKVRKLEIDIRLQLSIVDEADTQNVVITAVASVLDTLWVGTSTGHILVFHEDQLLNWCRPYTKYIRFLTCVPNTSLGDHSQCTVVSGAKGFHAAHPLLRDIEQEHDERTDSAGVLIVWEAYDAKTMKQVKAVEDCLPGLYSDHSILSAAIASGNFEDGARHGFETQAVSTAATK